ncbi:MerR family transcriptional regulator [Nonomuraea sp. NPDC003214]
MKIGDLARVTGVNVRLLRYYEDQGLLESVRTSGGHRTYAADAPARVGQIRALLGAGLPTKVIREVMPCFLDDGVGLQACVLDHVRSHLTDLDQRIDELQEARGALSELLDRSLAAAH